MHLRPRAAAGVALLATVLGLGPARVASPAGADMGVTLPRVAVAYVLMSRQNPDTTIDDARRALGVSASG